MPQVISASRRTDIPAFFSDWFVNRLKAGAAVVKQPYAKRFVRVSLRPQDVSAVVFWSKNYSPLLGKLGEIEKTTKNLFFHFTITANRELELDAPDYRDALRDYVFLVKKYSPAQVIWRYDPLCITDKLSYEIHEDRFVHCAESLKGYAKRCCISFVHPYKKVLANLGKYTDHRLVALALEQKREYARRLALRAEANGIGLYVCCNDYLLSETVKKASCIDGRFLSEIFQMPIDTRSASTRMECACTKSIDIGAYDTCGHGCLYCYANVDKDKAKALLERHNPEWNSLSLQVDEKEVAPIEERQGALRF